MYYSNTVLLLLYDPRKREKEDDPMSMRTRLRAGFAAALCLTALLTAAACSNAPAEEGGGDAAEGLGSLVVSVAGPEGASGDVRAKVYAGDVADELAEGAELEPVAEAAVPIGGEARAEGLAAGEVTVAIEASEGIAAPAPEVVEVAVGSEARVSFDLTAATSSDGAAVEGGEGERPSGAEAAATASDSEGGSASRAVAAQRDSSQAGSPAGCAHSWQPVTEQRWVANVVTVVDSEAWDEPVYATVCWCGALWSADHAMAHRDAGEDRGWYETVTVGSRCSKCGAQG